MTIPQTVFTKYGYHFTFEDNKSGEPVSEGDTVRSARGKKGTFEGIGRLGRLGDPKVIVDGAEYNANVWGLTPHRAEE